MRVPKWSAIRLGTSPPRTTKPSSLLSVMAAPVRLADVTKAVCRSRYGIATQRGSLLRFTG